MSLGRSSTRDYTQIFIRQFDGPGWMFREQSPLPGAETGAILDVLPRADNILFGHEIHLLSVLGLWFATRALLE